MQMHGKNMIGWQLSSAGEMTFRAYDPAKGEAMETVFYEATAEEVNRAATLADEAAPALRGMDAERIADFLMSVHEKILGIGDRLIEVASRESGLDETRLKGERERTLNQIKMFAGVAKEGSWVDARIETALPDRKPVPRPDLRRMHEAIGPVAVFGASNFPLAFSVAGGDTVSAFAARNPVIVKAHPAHPGTSELVGTAIVEAVNASKMPEGTFSMLHGRSPEMSLSVVTHPHMRAVGFTGSLRAGRAIFDAAARRPRPIPVYAEMGSVNPIFLLPGALKGRPDVIAEGLSRSVLAGMGQFCTCPGLVFGIKDESFHSFEQKVMEAFEQASPGTMLNPAIAKAYNADFTRVSGVKGVEAHVASRAADSQKTQGRPGFLTTDAKTWLANEELHEEVFGPSTIVIQCNSEEELLKAAEALEGSLTATIHGTAEELSKHSKLIAVLGSKAGRLVFNGFPTGVEVGDAMHHGGPYPATTDEKFTSVGVTAIYRFARPICYQNFPEHLLPAELRDANPRGMWRTVNGQLTRDGI